MTESTKARAIITASYILYFMNMMMDGKVSGKGSFIAFKQLLLSETRASAHLAYVMLSNRAWANVVNKYANDNYRMDIEDAIEFIAVNEMDAMTEMFGNKFEDTMYRMLAKLDFDHTDKTILAESRMIVNALTDETKKLVFEYEKVSV